MFAECIGNISRAENYLCFQMNRSNLILIPVIPDEWISTQIATIFFLQKKKIIKKKVKKILQKVLNVDIRTRTCVQTRVQECFLPQITSTPWARIYYEVQLTVVMLELS